MNSGFALLLVFGIGVVTGLRSMTAPAVVAWAAHLGWINLHGSPLAFMGSAWAVGIFTLGALGEFAADQLPTTPARTAAVSCSGCCDCYPRRPGCNWARTAAGFQILKFSISIEVSGKVLTKVFTKVFTHIQSRG